VLTLRSHGVKEEVNNNGCGARKEVDDGAKEARGEMIAEEGRDRG
jgi:hypothetical protein